MKLPTTYQPLFDAQQIKARVLSVAKEIDRWAEGVTQRSGKDIVAVPILKGALFFASDLLQALSETCTVFPVYARSYSDNQKARAVECDKVAVEKGSTILLIDEICESGETLQKLTQNFLEGGASEVCSVVMVKRLTPSAHVPTWSCFEYEGSEWLVGYGMDDCERFRNLSSIYKLV